MDACVSCRVGRELNSKAGRRCNSAMEELGVVGSCGGVGGHDVWVAQVKLWRCV